MQNLTDTSSTARRRSAIVMMDVVGFTTLTERDPPGTFSRFGTLLKTCIEPAVARHHGNVFRKLGDGMLVEFKFAYDALACVLEIHQRFIDQEHDLPLFRLRSAIHAGEVETWNEDLQGHAVNIAARLQDFAAPGGVVVSATVEELVRSRTTEAIEVLGDLALKGIERPVHAFYLLKRPTWSLAARRPSIAVLPFSEIELHACV